jgi:hypothetical protein
MEFEEAVSDPPLVHRRGGVELVWALGREPLRFIWETVNRESRTVETGLGLSTVVFALRRTAHTCIAPDKEQVARLRKHCQERRISLDGVTFVTKPSQEVVHSLPDDRKIDFALIDGGHGFPVPFLDWYYLSERLRVGGLVMVDDTQIWTGRVLKQFLRADPAWHHERDFDRTSVFRLTQPFAYREWSSQSYVRAKSAWPRRAHKMRRALQLAGQGRLRQLWLSARKELQ